MTIWQAVTRTLCVIALIAVGLSHRPPAFGPPNLSPAEIAALTLPDGSLPELCLGGEGEDGKNHSGTSHCDACLISSSVLTPTPVDVAGVRLAIVVAALLPPRFEAFHRHVFPPNAAPRAPPLPVFV
ncbi:MULTISPECIES: hypothetical protein [Alphaproteobacteria]|uniref:DUF2946 domain-containing protein n=2 Tax=Alphaproteobacteria TaxID=28211 RepID=A0A512HK97_9HYPH|nr:MULTISPECIES: hypothetical protein [Alphaproteobacteria]GEO85865.1 hypothetical protein RNA01_27970 [Ciceribacter naphthalenivorans]GLR21721.1 hypothetical protein GCM10007920_15070 [Ciceribacter naphthalenivorans]GLT04577.1 hypothetical protein GCM10007926_15070 [Sphingomonas psychrolutea]